MYGMISLGIILLVSCGGPKKAIEDVGRTEVQQETAPGVPEITFDEAVVDFGEVKKGETRAYSFQFTNTGDGDLLIELATACTCTSIEWPRKPIAPGEKGSIDIVFDSTTKDGDVSVDVDVISNTVPLVVTAVIKARIISEED